MEESVYRSTSETILIKLFSDSFPQFNYPHVKYTENTETDGSLTYSACIKLLGQNFNSGSKPSKELALEAVSSVAYEVVKEFRQLVLLETDSSLGCESLSSLFRPLKEEAVKVAKTVSQEAIRSVSIINSRLVEVENEKINMKVKAKNDKIVEKMQLPTSALIESRRIEPVPIEMAKIEMEPSSQIAKSSETDSKFQETKPSASPTHSDPNIRLSPLNISENDANVPKKTTTERKTNIGAPIPAFYEFVEKQSSTEPIIFDDFIKGANYGCRLRWGHKSWVAPAEHRQKKDAHNLAAVMACIELFGEGFTFEGVDPRIYVKWSRESVRKASDRYIFATSDELLAQESLNPPEPVDSSKLTVEPLSDGRKFTSVINEICQKMRFTPPNYQVSSVNALTNYYICTVKNFHDLPPMESLPFTKKNEAKEDAAGKIYYLLKQKGIVDEASRIIGRQRQLETVISDRDSQISQHSQSQLQSQTQVQQFPNSLHPNPPSAVPPMNMMQMMPMFMMAQMSMSQQQPGNFDPQMMQNFEFMMKQWQAFLSWQQQQQQQHGIESNILNPSTSHDYQNNQNSHQRPGPPHNQGQGRQSQAQQTHREHNYQYNQHSNSHENAVRTPRSYESNPQDPRLQGSRKRNYEESRRRYYD